MADIYRQLFDNKQGNQSEISVGNNTASVTFDAGPSLVLYGLKLPTPVLLDVDVQGGQKMENRVPSVKDASGQTFLLFYNEQGGFQAIDAAQVQAEIQPALNAARQIYNQGKDPRTGAPISAKDPVTGKDVNPGSESSHLYKVDGEVHTTVLLDREGKYVRHLTEGKPMFGDGLHKALVPVTGFDLTNPPVGQKLENTVAYDDSRSPLRYTAGADDGVKQYMENLEAYADAIKPEGGITLGTTPDVSAPEAVSKAAFPDLPDHQVAPEPAPQRAGRERAAPSVREPSREWPEILSPEQAPMRAPEVEKAEIPDASKDPVAALEAISKHLDDGKSLYGDDIGKIATTGDQAFRNDVALFAQEHRRNPDLTAQEYFDAKNAPKAAPEPVKPAAPSRTESTRQIDLPADMAIKGQGHYMNPTDAANIIRRDLNAGLAEYGAGMNTTKGRIHGLEEAAGDVKSLFPDAVDQNGRIDGGKLPEAVRDALGESGMDMIDDVNKGLDRLKPIEPDIAPQRGMESAPLLTPQ